MTVHSTVSALNEEPEQLPPAAPRAAVSRRSVLKAGAVGGATIVVAATGCADRRGPGRTPEARTRGRTHSARHRSLRRPNLDGAGAGAPAVRRGCAGHNFVSTVPLVRSDLDSRRPSRNRPAMLPVASEHTDRGIGTFDPCSSGQDISTLWSCALALP